MTITPHRTSRTTVDNRVFERLLIGIQVGAVRLDTRDWRYRNVVNGTDLDDTVFDAESRGWVRLTPGEPPAVTDAGVAWLADRYARLGPSETRPLALAPNPDEAARAQKTGAYRGERIHTARLNDEAVKTIRLRLVRGARGTDLAREYGVSDDTISKIKHNATWRHVA